MGENSAEQGLIQGPHRPREQEGQLLDDGRHRPCGPCSELHVDLTPEGDTRGTLVNKGAAECIEIWNLVFIQFNANPDGILCASGPARRYGDGIRARHGIIQGTKNFTEFAGARSPITRLTSSGRFSMRSKAERQTVRQHAAGLLEASMPDA